MKLGAILPCGNSNDCAGMILSLRENFIIWLNSVYNHFPLNLATRYSSKDLDAAIILTLCLILVCCLFLIGIVLILTSVKKSDSKISGEKNNFLNSEDNMHSKADKRKFLEDIRRFHQEQESKYNFNKTFEDSSGKSHFQRKRMAFTLNGKMTSKCPVDNSEIIPAASSFHTPPPSPRSNSNGNLIEQNKNTHIEKLCKTSPFSNIKFAKIVLHQYERARGIPCLSPGGLFLETFMRMLAIPHEVMLEKKWK